MKLRLITIGAKSPPWAESAAAHYVKRLDRWGGLSQVHLKPVRFTGDVSAVRDAEAERLLAQLAPRDALITLDERGRTLDTHDFSKLLAEMIRQTPGVLTFAIGGPYGHGEAARKRGAHVISLSKLVLNHQLARLVLIEQIYRAFTIHDGIPYHH